MATPTNINLESPYIVVEEGVSVLVDSIQEPYSFASVRVIHTGSAYAVDDPVAFKKEDAVWFKQSSAKFFVVDETKILFKVS